MTRTRAFWMVLAAVSVLAMVFGASRVWAAATDALSVDALDWRFAALSVAAMLAFVLVYAAGWWLLMSELEGRRAPLGAMRLFLLSWPGRYVPASLPYYGGRLVAGPGLGMSRSAVAASLVYENVFAIVASGGVALVVLAAGYRDVLGGSAWLAAAVVAVPLAALALHPGVGRTAVRVGSRRIKRLGALEAYVLRPTAIFRVGAVYVMGSLLAGLTFWFALRAVGADAPLPLAIAAYNIGGVAGMLAIAVPSGIGVREGVVVAVMSVAISPQVALSAALLARLAGVIADFTPFGIILLVATLRRVRGVAAPAPVPARVRERSRAA